MQLVVEIWGFPNELGWTRLVDDFTDLVKQAEASGYNAVGYPKTLHEQKVLNGVRVLTTTFYRENDQTTIEDIMTLLTNTI